jgi:hypothetical protein
LDISLEASVASARPFGNNAREKQPQHGVSRRASVAFQPETAMAACDARAVALDLVPYAPATVDALVWMVFVSPPVGALMAFALLLRAERLLRQTATAKHGRVLRRWAMVCHVLALLACGFAAIALTQNEPPPGDVLFELGFYFLLVGAWWGFWAGASLLPWLLQRSDLRMATEWRATEIVLALLFTLGLGLGGAAAGSIVWFGLLFAAVASLH